MSNADIVMRAMKLIESGKIDESARFFADDFYYTGRSSRPLDKDYFIRLHRELLAAFPDWDYGITGVHEEGDHVHLNLHIRGTFRGGLSLPNFGLFDAVPNNKRFNLPEEPVDVTVINGIIECLNAPLVPGGGIPGILEQLGLPYAVPATA